MEPGSIAAPTDSLVFGGLFGTPEMRAVFSDAAVTRHYLDIEVAIAEVQGELGLIPVDAAAEIGRAAARLKLDLGQLGRDTVLVGYPIVGTVRQLADACAGGAGEYVHWGATTQDIMDTAVVLQVREALDLLDTDLQGISLRLRELAALHRDTPMSGRTHLKQAVPITFGYKCAVWLSGIERHRERLEQLRPRVLVGQLAGAAGTLASFGSTGLEMQAAVLARLGLRAPSVTWHVARDTLAEVVCWLGLVVGTVSKIALDVTLLSMDEVNEVREADPPGRGSSSTMPQKHNPIGSEIVLASGRIVRQQVALMLDASVQDLERGTGPWHAEWYALPQAFVVSAAALSHSLALLHGLKVDEAQMRRNLQLTGGRVMAESVVMALGVHLGRRTAYGIVYQACSESEAHGRPLIDLLEADPDVSGVFDRQALLALLDPALYLGSAGLMVDHVLRGGQP